MAKKSGSTGLGSAYGKQAHMAKGSGVMGGITSGKEKTSALKSTSVTKTGSAYAHQEKFPTGKHGGGPETKDSLMKNLTVSKGGAYKSQAHFKDAGTKPELCCEMQDKGYLGHFAQEKFLRQGHNSDGVIGMDAADNLPADVDMIYNGGKKTPAQNVQDGKDVHKMEDDLDLDENVKTMKRADYEKSKKKRG